ncbi:hypothetical protein [Parvularcula marina]|uniref:Uncharacterized protein n=1 Tax=Parvularcula marina TaxID=2292771 RepID=A0A371RH81_9PROT|nr:hypothetical protein [Parvularcula marina]RFB04792.1 hypothetical protein DX908_05550 [Parvularcula marina]
MTLPFPRAHFYVAAFFVVTIIAFHPSYFSALREAPAAHHFHGITATLWIVLLVTQSWSIHHRSWRVHAWSGRASLLLVPLFVAAGLLVTKITLLSPSPFTPMFGIPLAVADLAASIGFPFLYFLGLRNRRFPDRHARYMLSTVFLLVGPSIARLFANFVPGFWIRSPEELYKFGWSVDLSFGLACLFIIILMVRDGGAGKPVIPFGVGLGATLAMFLGYKVLGDAAFWVEGLSQDFAALSDSVIVTAGLLIGGLAGWLGWTFPAGQKAKREGDEVTV